MVESMVSVNDVAKAWKVNHKTVRELVRKGELRSVRVAGAIRIPEAALAEYQEKNSARQQPPASGPELPPSSGGKTGYVAGLSPRQLGEIARGSVKGR